MKFGLSLLSGLFERENLSSLEEFLEAKPVSLGRDAIDLNERGVCEIVYSSGNHCANGLLIGQGYFVTVKHAFMSGISGKRVVDYSGEAYPLFKKVFCSKSMDLALCSFSGARENFFGYNFSEYVPSPSIDPSVLISRWDGKIKHNGCMPVHNNIIRSIKSENIFYNHEMPLYCFNMASAISGDSGGIFSSLDGKVFGLEKGSWEGEFGKFEYAVKSEYIKRLIKSYLSFKKRK